MIIIELIGLSGCGKSTLCKKIQAELEKKNIQTAYLQNTLPANSFYGKAVHFVKSKVAMKAPGNQAFKDEILDGFNKIKMNSSETYQYWLEKILMLNYDCMRAEKHGVEVGLIDEGFVQFITSILQKRYAGDSLFSIVEALNREVYKSRTLFVNCLLEPEKCFERMRARGRYAGGVDGDSLENTVNNLSGRRKNMDILMQPLDKDAIIEVRMEGDDNIDDIMSAIYNKLEKQHNIK